MLTSIVLMAGFSRRMGKPKQHVFLHGKTFLQHIVEKLKLFPNDISKMVFVVQENDFEGKKYVNSFGGIWLTNPEPELGPLSSIRIALENIDKDSAILLWPTDHPMISFSTVKELIESWKNNSELITVPSDGNRRGHPGIYPSWCRNYFFEIDLNLGARQIMQMFPQKINHVLVDDPWIRNNINTPELLAEAEKAFAVSNFDN